MTFLCVFTALAIHRSLTFLLDDFLVLRGDKELRLLSLHQLVVLPDGLGDLGLGHSHRVDLQTRRHLRQVLI